MSEGDRECLSSALKMGNSALRADKACPVEKAFVQKVNAAFKQQRDQRRLDEEDAAKWRALRNCARITSMGSAGCEPGGNAVSAS